MLGLPASYLPDSDSGDPIMNRPGGIHRRRKPTSMRDLRLAGTVMSMKSPKGSRPMRSAHFGRSTTPSVSSERSVLRMRWGRLERTAPRSWVAGSAPDLGPSGPASAAS